MSERLDDDEASYFSVGCLPPPHLGESIIHLIVQEILTGRLSPKK